jgi:TIR domain
MAEETWDVLISYRHSVGQDGSDPPEGKAFIESIERVFDRLEVKYFKDVESIKPGSLWGDAIEQAVNACGAVLCVTGERYWDSKNCISEFGAALNQDKAVAVRISSYVHNTQLAKATHYTDVCPSSDDLRHLGASGSEALAPLG